MDNETLNLSIRKFFEMVGLNSQREIEQPVAKSPTARAFPGSQTLASTMTLELAALQLKVKFNGYINVRLRRVARRRQG